MGKYKTTIYVATVPEDNMPTRWEVRELIWKRMKELAEKRDISFLAERQRLIYDGTETAFVVKDISSDKLYLLSFLPTGEDKNKWGTQGNKQAASDVLKFCDLLGSEITISTTQGALEFERIMMSDQDVIDISNWEINYFFSRPPRKSPLRNFVNETFQARFENILSSIQKDNNFYIFTQPFSKVQSHFLN